MNKSVLAGRRQSALSCHSLSDSKADGDDLFMRLGELLVASPDIS